MLKIRKEQVKVLRASLLHEQIMALIPHVQEHFPYETGDLLEEDLYEHIGTALERADQYDIRAERDVYKYVNISMVYGPDFDTQEEMAWTADFLTDEDVDTPTQRMNRLYQEVIRRIEVEENDEKIMQKHFN